MDVMDGMIERAERGYVCAIAVHALMVARHDPEMRAALHGSSLNVPDGRPLVWALNLLGDKLPDRVYGPELMDALLRARRASAATRCGCTAATTRRRWTGSCRALERALPGHRDRRRLVAAPPPADRRRGSARSRGGSTPTAPTSSGSAIGVPKQEKWMARMRPRLEAPRAGRRRRRVRLPRRACKRQAPAWMQRRGLEWLFRLSQEPRRLVRATCATTRRSWRRSRASTCARGGDRVGSVLYHRAGVSPTIPPGPSSTTSPWSASAASACRSR